MDTKQLAFSLMMGALGSAFFAISYAFGSIAPGINLDLSLIAVLIAGFYGGPTVGLFSGLIAGILPGIMFGPLGMGGALGLVGLPLGKGLSGLTSGLIGNTLRIGGKKQRPSILGFPASFLSYVPEAFFTVGYFALLQGVVVGPATYLLYILPKALIELTIVGLIMAALIGNTGFCNFTRAFTKRECRITASNTAP